MLLLVHVMGDYIVLTSRPGLVDTVLYINKRVLKDVAGFINAYR